MMTRNPLLQTMFVLLTSVLVAQYSWGAPDEEIIDVSQTFSIKNMTCAACPVTVKKAMSRVDGVVGVAVNFNAKTVTVAYDPARADIEEIAAASTSVGFPAYAVAKP